jgi:hypothetical protein
MLKDMVFVPARLISRTGTSDPLPSASVSKSCCISVEFDINSDHEILTTLIRSKGTDGSLRTNIYGILNAESGEGQVAYW